MVHFKSEIKFYGIQSKCEYVYTGHRSVLIIVNRLGEEEKAWLEGRWWEMAYLCSEMKVKYLLQDWKSQKTGNAGCVQQVGISRERRWERLTRFEIIHSFSLLFSRQMLPELLHQHLLSSFLFLDALRMLMFYYACDFNNDFNFQFNYICGVIMTYAVCLNLAIVQLLMTFSLGPNVPVLIIFCH